MCPTPSSVSRSISQNTLALILPFLSVEALDWIDSLSLSFCFSRGIGGR